MLETKNKTTMGLYKWVKAGHDKFDNWYWQLPNSSRIGIFSLMIIFPLAGIIMPNPIIKAICYLAVVLMWVFLFIPKILK